MRCVGIKMVLEDRTSYTFDRLSIIVGLIADIREKQSRLSTDIGAPGVLDLRRVRTVLR